MDPGAIRALVERFEGPARRLGAALLRDEHLAQDAAQEAFIEAVRRMNDLRDPRALPGWLRQIVRTQANRILRRNEIRGVGELAEVPSPLGSPPQEAEVEELRREVRQALARLPALGRQTAELFYMEGLSVAEVAAALEVPTGTVKRRLHDARHRLHDLLIGSARAMERTSDDRRTAERTDGLDG
jgi:RNA polymerase sigma factor (sigma-70 family)